jgi:GT2 family glycosyltransferase
MCLSGVFQAQILHSLSGRSLCYLEAHPEMDTDPKVSIIIVHYKGLNQLLACLSSLGSTKQPAIEVLIVDNGSSENIAAALTDPHLWKLIRSDRNLGFAGGNNLGLNHCKGKYVLLLNDDTIANPEFVSALSRYLDDHPNVGIVQGKMLLPRFENTLDVCGSFLTAFGLPYHYGYYKPDGPKYHRNYPVFSAKGACLMFRRELISRVGGFLFDEDFFCYYEETDFCHRSWLAGYEVHFVASPPIQHLMGATAGASQSAFVLRHYLRNMTFSLLSNLSFTSRLRILPLFFTTLLASMFAAACTLKRDQFAAHLGAITHCIAHYGKILKRRRLVKQIRRQSDQALFAKVLRTPRLEYFLKTLTGKLSQYQDDPLL